MNYNNEIKWNSALQDLEILTDIEKNLINAYIANDIVLYYKLMNAYFMKLCTMIDFDKSEYLRRMKEIKYIIFSGDLNNDGVLDEFELMRHNAKLGKAMENLENIYYKLTEIKVDAGLSVQKADLIKSLKYKDDNEKRKIYPILDLK